MPYNGALGTNDPDDRDRLPRNMAGLTAQCFDHGIAFRIIACAHYNNEVVGLLFFRADNEPALVAMENSPGYIKPLELLRAHVPGQLLSADGRVR